ncbi:MAG: hypothetical protein M1834_003368 [Cirrosporium novae-zelandiae]|nr:MAG: hypothetical protein M1834_003368 [Cirrosporium novae-zelandiae]
MADKIRQIALEEAGHIKALTRDAASSGAYLYPLKGIFYFATHRSLWKPLVSKLVPTVTLGIGITTAMFVFTYLPQAAILAIFNGPIAAVSAALLVLNESSTILNFVSKNFIIGDALLDTYDGTLVSRSCSEVVSQERPVKSGGDPIARLGRLAKRPFAKLGPSAIVRYFLYLPLNFIPVVGTITFVILQGKRRGPEAHTRYFQLKQMSNRERKEHIQQRRGAYTGFGIVAVLLEMSNGTIYVTPDGQSYKISCGIDYPGRDLILFILASTFDDCIGHCDFCNLGENNQECIGAYSLDDPTAFDAGVEIDVAILLNNLTTMPSSNSAVTTSTFTLSSHLEPSSVEISKTITSSSSSSQQSVSSIIIPSVPGFTLFDPSINIPSTQYIDWKLPPLITLDIDLLVAGINGSLSTDYSMAFNTGILNVNESTKPMLTNLVETPHLSRDGGKGGYLGGQHLFIFCDTGSYTMTTPARNGDFLGFVSSSVAIDIGLNGINKQPLSLQDRIGQWGDDQGRTRGSAP